MVESALVLSGISKKTKLPAWLNPSELPPIALEESSLSPQQVSEVLIALKSSTFAAPHPSLAALKSQAQAASLDRFAWRLFEIWLSQGAPSKDNWAMRAVGLLGNDTSVLKLAPLIRAMPGEGCHKRAILGLDCLSAIATDTALMQISAIAQKVKYKSLKQKAEECMTAIAQARSLSREQLDDRIVPSCGLNSQGTRIFEYGARQFQVVFGGEMQPKIRDAEGKLKPNLPKPKASDDATLAEQAIADWNVLKQQIQSIAKTQSDRLEKAMIMQRRWHLEDFETYLVQHPLMTNLAQRLVWGLYDASGFFTSFRVTEDRTYANAHDETLRLPIPSSTHPPIHPSTIGLLHPAQISQELRNTWGELFSDYELIQPFRQLSRTVFSLEPDEAESDVLNRFQGAEVSAMIVAAILEKTGWQSTMNPNKRLHCHCKPFAVANITAVIEHPSGTYFGYDSGGVRLGACFFLPSLYPNLDWQQEKRVLREVDPVVMSEVLRNLGAIAAKGTD
jgi:hypothetical protein